MSGDGGSFCWDETPVILGPGWPEMRAGLLADMPSHWSLWWFIIVAKQPVLRDSIASAYTPKSLPLSWLRFQTSLILIIKRSVSFHCFQYCSAFEPLVATYVGFSQSKGTSGFTSGFLLPLQVWGEKSWRESNVSCHCLYRWGADMCEASEDRDHLDIWATQSKESLYVSGWVKSNYCPCFVH